MAQKLASSLSAVLATLLAGWLAGLLAGCLQQLKMAAWQLGFASQLKVAARMENGFQLTALKRFWTPAYDTHIVSYPQC